MAKYATIYPMTSMTIVAKHRMTEFGPTYMAECGRILTSKTEYGGIWPYMAEYGKLWKSVA